MADYQTLIVESPETAPGVRLIRLNRPEALNALNTLLLAELGQALAAAQADDAIGCIVVTGSAKAFAAGADIKEMSDKSYAQMFKDDFFALGGGCELAMMCDFILAADTAKFGQPEINLGVAPGIGGTQRLTRLVGKSKAMDMILTGRMMGAEEAERAGLASRIFPADTLVDEALAVAARIAAQSPLATAMNKELVNAAYETTLSTGVALERRLFHSLFAFDDQKEGMAAFVEKRKPAFKGS
jgi:enoyl-CoA hydratase